MTDQPGNPTAAWISLLVVGISLNTIGIVLRDAGPLRYLLIGAGLLLLLVSVLKLASSHGSGGGPPG